MRFLLALLPGLALLGTACSTTRAYEGPPRQEHEVAVITGYPKGTVDQLSTFGHALTFQEHWFTRIVGVDGINELTDWSDGTVEVLPGRHTVRAGMKTRQGNFEQRYPVYVGSFEAQAGREYQVRGRASSLTGEAGFDIWDVEGDVIVGTSDAGPEECVTAKLDWGGRHWTQADWGRIAELTTTSYVPSGEVLSSWREIVELQYMPAWEPLDLDEIMAIKLEELEDVDENAYQTPLESAPGMRVFTWSAVEEEAGVQQGVTCLRNGPQGCHIMVYATRGVLEPVTALQWAERFKAAELLQPTF